MTRRLLKLPKNLAKVSRRKRTSSLLRRQKEGDRLIEVTRHAAEIDPDHQEKTKSDVTKYVNHPVERPGPPK